MMDGIGYTRTIVMNATLMNGHRVEAELRQFKREQFERLLATENKRTRLLDMRLYRKRWEQSYPEQFKQELMESKRGERANNKAASEARLQRRQVPESLFPLY